MIVTTGWVDAWCRGSKLTKLEWTGCNGCDNTSADGFTHSLAHDNVIKDNYFPRHWPFVKGKPRSPVLSPHKGHCSGALTFPLICTWTNSWAKNRDVGDLRCHRTHYDVTVLINHRSMISKSLMRTALSCIDINLKEYQNLTLNPNDIMTLTKLICRILQIKWHMN